MKHILPLLFLSISLVGAIQEVEITQLAPGKINETMPERITPPAGPRIENGIDAFITADFLYWTVRMDGLSYVVTGFGNNGNDVSKGKTQYPDWDWNPGFKVGLGLNLPHDGWDIGAEYNWFHSTAINSTQNTGNGMLPSWNIANILTLMNSNNGVTAARTDWDITLNTIDLSLGRNYFISSFLTLRPFIGFTGSWVYQNYSTSYHLSEASLVTNVKMRNNQNFWGIGLLTGLNSAWHLNQTWSFYGDCALAALWSQFQVHRKDTRNDSANSGGVTNPPLNTTITTFDSADNFHTIKATLEFGVGLRGEWWFSEDRYHFLVQAGWEEHLWINYNQLIQTSVAQAHSGDLIMQGLTFKLRFDF